MPLELIIEITELTKEEIMKIAETIEIKKQKYNIISIQHNKDTA